MGRALSCFRPRHLDRGLESTQRSHKARVSLHKQQLCPDVHRTLRPVIGSSDWIRAAIVAGCLFGRLLSAQFNQLSSRGRRHRRTVTHERSESVQSSEADVNYSGIPGPASDSLLRREILVKLMHSPCCRRCPLFEGLQKFSAVSWRWPRARVGPVVLRSSAGQQ